MPSTRLTVTAERQVLAPLPVATCTGTLDLVGTVSTLAETTASATGRSQATQLAMLVNRLCQPVDSGVIADDSVLRVHKDDLEILVYTILVYPVGVEHPEVSTFAANAFLCCAPKRSLELELVNTMVLGLTVNDTLAVWALTPTTSDSYTVDNVAKFGLVAKATCLVDAGGAHKPHNLRHLPVLPRTNTQQEAEHIALLLAPEHRVLSS